MKPQPKYPRPWRIPQRCTNASNEKINAALKRINKQAVQAMSANEQIEQWKPSEHTWTDK